MPKPAPASPYARALARLARRDHSEQEVRRALHRDGFAEDAVEDVVSVHDLHATMLHLLGIDHTRLTFKLLGRDFRLTDVHGQVVKDRVEMHDLHATMLHLLGVDHKRLTFRFGGRDMRLTDVHGELIEPILA